VRACVCVCVCVCVYICVIVSFLFLLSFQPPPPSLISHNHPLRPSLPPSLLPQDVAYVNSSHVISQQPKMTAINSCVEIDLTGQVVSDSIGPIIYSGWFLIFFAHLISFS